MIDQKLDEVDYQAAVESTLEDILSDCRFGSRIALEYAYSTHIDNPEDYDPRRSGEIDSGFLEFARWTARERVADEVNRIATECVFEEGMLVLWRELVVDENWIDGAFRERPIGVCWSWDKNYAEAHHAFDSGKPGRVKVLVKGLADLDSVDWQMTVVLNAAHPYTVGDEKEIRLLAGRMIEIDTIWIVEGRIRDAAPARELRWPGSLVTGDPKPDYALAP